MKKKQEIVKATRVITTAKAKVPKTTKEKKEAIKQGKEAIKQGKVAGGPFRKGDPRINRKGRPKSKMSEIRAAFQGRWEELVNQVIDQALSGDTAMLTLAMRYVSPPPKEREIRLDYPPNATVIEKLQVISQAVSDAEITPSEGKTMSDTFLAEFNYLELQRVMEENKKIAIQINN